MMSRCDPGSCTFRIYCTEVYGVHFDRTRLLCEFLSMCTIFGVSLLCLLRGMIHAALKLLRAFARAACVLLDAVAATHVDLLFSRLSSQNRIEEAHTSDTLKKTVGMTRSMDMAAEREKGERARAAAQRAKDLPVESKETPDPR